MISRQFEAAGYTKTEFHDPADLYVINTCSVTENADREFRKIVNRAKRLAPTSRIAVIGCYAQLRPEQVVKQGGVDLVLGAREKFNLLEHVQYFGQPGAPLVVQDTAVDELHGCIPSFSLGDRTRSFLKIQDGCDYPCTYCTIPLARGKSRSQEIASLVSQAEEIAARGVKEIVLTGVNVGDYRSLGGQGLQALLTALEAVEGIKRIRISSIEPNLLTDEIIDLVAASDKILPHFHIPLQSGSDRVLGLMKRRYLSDPYHIRILAVRQRMPVAGIGADVIVGFPGEGDEEFQETVDLLTAIDVSYLHVFTYSERPQTAALELPGRVNRSVRKHRNRVLTELSSQKTAAFAIQQLNTVQQVLFEGSTDGQYTGMTQNYLKVFVPDTGQQLGNQIRAVELTAFKNGQLLGVLK